MFKTMLKRLKKRVVAPRVRYACPCGYRTASRETALKHLATHPDGMGRIDYGTGRVAW